jgi:hypothetical protein
LASCERVGLEPGDSIKKALLFAEFSLSQHTFKTYEQYMSWDKAIDSRKKKYGWSLEPYFLNKDGLLNFQEMTNWVADALGRDVLDPFKELDPNHDGNRKKGAKEIGRAHPAKKDVESISKSLKGYNEE